MIDVRELSAINRSLKAYLLWTRASRSLYDKVEAAEDGMLIDCVPGVLAQRLCSRVYSSAQKFQRDEVEARSRCGRAA